MSQDLNSVPGLDDEALGWGESSAPTTNAAPVSEPAQLLDTESTMTPDATGCGPDHQPFDEAGLFKDIASAVPAMIGSNPNADFVRNAFPTAPAPFCEAISNYMDARASLEKCRALRQTIEDNSWHSDTLTRLCLETARKAYDFLQAARRAAGMTVHDEAVRTCYRIADGMIAGTSNNPVFQDADGFALLGYTSQLRQQLLKQAPALKETLVEVEHVAPALPVNGVTALSAAGWVEFCKRLDVLNVVYTKALIWALKHNCPNYPVPLGTATDSH